ncbi:unnamed protein product [Rotaria magnacalcarata]|uniref:Ninjurin-2 n=1 Tax=Rotaria magnacalcarata TaxID=392030 RepID=A0A816ZKF6_9BILA|nr:unnamed protein product [Rotaria magnacalcarata]
MVDVSLGQGDLFIICLLSPIRYYHKRFIFHIIYFVYAVEYIANKRGYIVKEFIINNKIMPKSNMAFEDTDDDPSKLDQGKTTVNSYATKKTVAISNLEIALLATNAVQLKTLLGNKANKDTLWAVGLGLVCASIVFQVVNACVLVLLGTDDIGKKQRQHRLISLNNFSLIISLLITVINVVLSVIVAVEPAILSQSLNSTNAV